MIYKTVAIFWTYAMFNEYLHIRKMEQNEINALERSSSKVSNEA